MKNLKSLFIIALVFTLFACSKDDDGDSSGNPQPEYNATITGGSFGNYTSTLGSFSANSTNGLTVAVTDANNHVIRFFLNSTGGFSSGVVKQIGNVDGNNFTTTVIIRDQDAQLTYNSTQGNITITSLQDGDEPDTALISCSFNITAIETVSGDEITMTGTFKNINYLK